VNIYEMTFLAPCPVNNVVIEYAWRMESPNTVMVEDIVDFVAHVEGFHEVIASELYAKFQGHQTMTAYHHGVRITTLRP